MELFSLDVSVVQQLFLPTTPLIYSLQKKEKLYEIEVLLLYLCTFLIKSSRMQ